MQSLVKTRVESECEGAESTPKNFYSNMSTFSLSIFANFVAISISRGSTATKDHPEIGSPHGFPYGFPQPPSLRREQPMRYKVLEPKPGRGQNRGKGGSDPVRSAFSRPDTLRGRSRPATQFAGPVSAASQNTTEQPCNTPRNASRTPERRRSVPIFKAPPKQSKNESLQLRVSTEFESGQYAEFLDPSYEQKGRRGSHNAKSRRDMAGESLQKLHTLRKSKIVGQILPKKSLLY